MPLVDYQVVALKKFNKDIISCGCDHNLFHHDGKIHYCEKCIARVLEFMSTYGLGVMCNDIPLEELGKENAKLKSENLSLQHKLELKIKEYDKLLQKVN